MPHQKWMRGTGEAQIENVKKSLHLLEGLHYQIRMRLKTVT